MLNAQRHPRAHAPRSTALTDCNLRTCSCLLPPLPLPRNARSCHLLQAVDSLWCCVSELKSCSIHPSAIWTCNFAHARMHPCMKHAIGNTSINNCIFPSTPPPRRPDPQVHTIEMWPGWWQSAMPMVVAVIAAYLRCVLVPAGLTMLWPCAHSSDTVYHACSATAATV
jgi:hypothetical protein